MRYLIIDDEPAFVEKLRQFVLSICTDCQLVVADDPDLLLSEGKNYDVILLDIEMPGCSGLDLASRLNEQKGSAEKPYIIFVTNRDGLVFEALKQQPFSFVRKSHLEELAPCLRRLAKLCEQDDYYPVKSGRIIERISLKDVAYLEKRKNYVIYHTIRGEFRERNTLDGKSDLLDKGFLRTHIGYLVNIRHIEKIRTADIILSDGAVIPLSRKYHNHVRQCFFEWMVNSI